MKIKKILTLAAALLLSGTVAVGCAPTSSSEPSSSEEPVSSEPISSEETIDAAAVIKDAADYIWQMYRSIDNSQATGSFKVVNRVMVGRNAVDVEWTLTVDGTEEAFKLEVDGLYSTFVSGYYDGLVKVDSNIKLVPTYKFGDVTKTSVEIYAEEEAKKEFNLTAKELILNTRADWDKDDGGKTTMYNIKGTVTAIVGGGSSSDGSFYLTDSEGYGYYAYKPTTKISSLSVGDVVVVSGVRSDYNNQQEFGSKCTYGIATEAEKGYVIPEAGFVDVTADFAAAESNKDRSLDKYQNRPIEIKNATLKKVSGSYIYFTVGDSEVEFNIYDTYYWLTAAERADYMNAFIAGKKVNIKGLNSYYNGHQVYGLTGHPVVEFVDELTLEEKQGIDAKYVKDVASKVYEENAEIKLLSPKYADKVEWTITADNGDPTATIENGKLTISPVKGREVVNTIKATLTYGTETKSYETKVTTEDLSITKWKTESVTNKVLGLTDEASTVTKEVDAKASKQETVKVTIEATNLIKSDKDHIFFKKYTAGDTLKITAPEGYTFKQITLEIDGSYNNFNAHDGADTTATKLSSTKGDKSSSGNGTVFTYKPTGSVVLLDTPEDVKYDCKIETISVVLVKTAA